MRTARAISLFLLRAGCLLAFWAALSCELRCAELPDAPLPANTLLAENAAAKAETSDGEGIVPDGKGLCTVDSSDGRKIDQSCASQESHFRQSVVEGHSLPLSPLGKLRVAGLDLIDPGNLVIITGGAVAAVATNSHSPYGPGMSGFAKYAGTSFTKSATGEFFCTFLVPAIAHQDPRYHRMPRSSLFRRVEHTAIQVIWTKSDRGLNIPNYGNLFGLEMAKAVDNLFVPGRRTSAGPTAERWALGLASAPVDNLITEFIPDVAKHVHFRVVAFQRMMDSMTQPDPK